MMLAALGVGYLCGGWVLPATGGWLILACLSIVPQQYLGSGLILMTTLLVNAFLTAYFRSRNLAPRYRAYCRWAALGGLIGAGQWFLYAMFLSAWMYLVWWLVYLGTQT